MKLYRFSPIQSEEEMRESIAYMHWEAGRLCKQVLGRHLPVAGNVGIFCHYEDEYEYLTGLREQLTKESENFAQKYFRLHEPIIVEAKDDVPEATYEFLYIRRPDPYRHHVGDIDFVLEEPEYSECKQRLERGEKMPGARVFPRQDPDMIELFDPDSDVLSYVSPEKMDDLVG